MLRTTRAGIRRTLGTAPQQKAPVINSELRGLLATAAAAGRRDRAASWSASPPACAAADLGALDAEDATETGSVEGDERCGPLPERRLRHRPSTGGAPERAIMRQGRSTSGTLLQYV